MKALVTLSFLGLIALTGCSGSSSSTTGTGGSAPAVGCAANPFSCPAGQTCWASMSAGDEFKCLNSGPGKVGEACQNTYDAPTCGDGLACYAVNGVSLCTAYCDSASAAHACPGHAVCQPLMDPRGPVIHECEPSASGTGGAGGKGAAGAAGKGIGGAAGKGTGGHAGH